MEKRLAILESELGQPDNFQKQGTLLNEYQQLQAELKKEMADWEKLVAELGY